MLDGARCRSATAGCTRTVGNGAAPRIQPLAAPTDPLSEPFAPEGGVAAKATALARDVAQGPFGREVGAGRIGHRLALRHLRPAGGASQDPGTVNGRVKTATVLLVGFFIGALISTGLQSLDLPAADSASMPDRNCWPRSNSYGCLRRELRWGAEPATGRQRRPHHQYRQPASGHPAQGRDLSDRIRRGEQQLPSCPGRSRTVAARPSPAGNVPCVPAALPALSSLSACSSWSACSRASSAGACTVPDALRGVRT